MNGVSTLVKLLKTTLVMGKEVIQSNFIITEVLYKLHLVQEVLVEEHSFFVPLTNTFLPHTMEDTQHFCITQGLKFHLLQVQEDIFSVCLDAAYSSNKTDKDERMGGLMFLSVYLSKTRTRGGPPLNTTINKTGIAVPSRDLFSLFCDRVSSLANSG